MGASSEYECDVVTVSPDASCVDAAEKMDINTVGCVVVAQDGVPVGMLTDRDLVCRVLAEGRNPEKVSVAEVMTGQVVTATRGDDIEALMKLMGERRIRRIPLLEDGKLVSLLSLEDLVQQVSSYLFNYSQSALHGLQESRRTARSRRRRELHEDTLDDLRDQAVKLSESARKAVREQLEDLLGRL